MMRTASTVFIAVNRTGANLSPLHPLAEVTHGGARWWRLHLLEGFRPAARELGARCRRTAPHHGCTVITEGGAHRALVLAARGPRACCSPRAVGAPRCCQRWEKGPRFFRTI